MYGRWILAGLLLGTLVSIGLAQEKPQPKQHLLSQISLSDGRRILCVNYPCDSSPKTALEIRIMDEKTLAEPHLTRPVFFRYKIYNEMNSDSICVGDVFSDCFLNDTDDTVVRDLEYRNSEMKMFGWKTNLGPREGAVLYKEVNPHTDNEELTLIFPDASHCPFGKNPTQATPFDAKIFAFELFPPQFDEPRELQVWVVNGERILAQERISWKGRRDAWKPAP